MPSTRIAEVYPVSRRYPPPANHAGGGRDRRSGGDGRYTAFFLSTLTSPAEAMSVAPSFSRIFFPLAVHSDESA